MHRPDPHLHRHLRLRRPRQADRHQRRPRHPDQLHPGRHPPRLPPTSIRAGNVTTETAVTGATTKTTSRCYAGTQQTTQTDPGGTTSKYWYDQLGRLWCITTTTVTDRSACEHSDGAPADARLHQVNTYDYLDHLIATRRYRASDGAKTDSASYVYDALDRIASERETHTLGAVADRTTTFAYLGLSNQAVNDHQSTVTVCGATDRPTLTADKTYLYDADGHRITLGDRSASCASRLPPPFPNRYDYGYDVHGSVATLNKDGTTGAASAVYAYTPYGTEDDQADQPNALSKGDVLQSTTAVNGTTRNDNPSTRSATPPSATTPARRPWTPARAGSTWAAAASCSRTSTAAPWTTWTCRPTRSTKTATPSPAPTPSATPNPTATPPSPTAAAAAPPPARPKVEVVAIHAKAHRRPRTATRWRPTQPTAAATVVASRRDLPESTGHRAPSATDVGRTVGGATARITARRRRAETQTSTTRITHHTACPKRKRRRNSLG